MARPLRVGDAAPPFAAQDAQGRTWRLDDLRGTPFVLAFYPADHTPNCTTEACAFRDAHDDFADVGVRVFGVSRDPPERHASFARRHGLAQTLLSDPSGTMHRDYGAFYFAAIPRRVTYLVDADGRIAAVFDRHLQPLAHAARMLEAARGLARRP